MTMERLPDVGAPMIPTADHIARAIIAAARIVGVDPIEVATHHQLPKNRENARACSRARSYAALAIADLVGDDTKTALIFQMVSTGVHTLRWQIRKGGLKWYSARVTEKVKSAVGLEPLERPTGVFAANLQSLAEAPPAAPPAAAPAIGRPFANDRQRRAYEELQRAVQNTAGLPRET